MTDDVRGNGRNAPERVTLKEVARRAGVHPATVSKVLNHDPHVRVSGETRERIRQVAAESGYQADWLARSLKTGRTQLVGMLIPDLENPFFAAMYRGVEEAGWQSGYNVILVNTDDSPRRFEELLRSIGQGHVDGLLIATAHRTDPTIDRVRDVGLPYVLLNRRRDDEQDAWVIPDDFAGGRIAVEFLYRLGHRRIGHIAGSDDISTTHTRQLGFRAGMEEVGLPIDERAIVPGGLTEDAGEAAMTRMLMLPADRRPTAILAANDLAARGAMRVAYAAGLEIPEDLSVMGYTDMPLAARSRPDLTTVRVPIRTLGRLAMETLVRYAEGEPQHPPVHVTLPVEIVVRHSTTKPRELSA